MLYVQSYIKKLIFKVASSTCMKQMTLLLHLIFNSVGYLQTSLNLVKLIWHKKVPVPPPLKKNPPNSDKKNNRLCIPFRNLSLLNCL